MEKQSQILKGLHAALDELELLAIEGENLDLDVIENIQKKFDRLKKIVQQQKNS